MSISVSVSPKDAVWVSKVEGEEGKKFVKVVASTARKDSSGDGKLYSTWYLKFLKDAYNKVGKELLARYQEEDKNEHGFLKVKIPVNIVSMSLTNEPYEKDGQKVYKNLQMAVWDAEFWSRDGASPSKSKTEDEEEWLKE